jgi:hypothetical protein
VLEINNPLKYVVRTSRKEEYDGRYKLDDEVVYVWSVEQTESPDQEAAPKVTKVSEVGPTGMMHGV